MANDIVVRFGAVLDRSYDVVMAEMAKGAERVRRAQTRSLGGSDAAAMYGPGQREFARSVAYREALQRASEKRMQSETDRSEREKTKIAMREMRSRAAAEASLQRQRSSAMMNQFRSDERATEAHHRAMARSEAAAIRARTREADRFATRTSHRAVRFFVPPPEGALGTMRRIGLDVARGAGVDFSLSSGIGKAREREAAAVALSNQGWNPDAQGFEQRISAAELRKVAKEQAARLGLRGEDEVMTAMTKFTDVTGDLATAKTIIGDIGLLARATGTDLGAAASAAADISAQLPEDMQGAARQQTMSMLMNVAAMQGKRGAVEVKDLARYVPRIAAQAGAFGAPAQNTIVDLLAATQIARRYGGAGNAAQAATATSAMVNTLKTPARVAAFRKAFAKAGMTGEHADLYDPKTGQLRDLFSIIKDSIVASSVDKDPQVAFKKMWGNVLGAKGPEGMMNIFKKAGGGKAGLAAIDAERAKFTAALSPEAQKKMLSASMSTTESAANRFQQRLDQVTEDMGGKLLPVLERLAPTVLQLTESFSRAVTWAAENPGKAITAAIVASIGRAGIESGIRLLLDRAATSLFGGGLPGAVLGGVGGGGPGRPGLVSRGAGAVGGALSGGMGRVANSIGVIGVAAASFMITDAILNSANTTVNEARYRQATSGNDIVSRFSEMYREAKTDEERAAAKQWATKNLEQDEASRGPMDKLFGDSSVFFNSMKAIEETAKKSDELRKRGTEQQQYQAATGQSTMANDISVAVAKELTGMMQKTLTVRVANTEDFKLFSETGSPPGPGPLRYP